MSWIPLTLKVADAWTSCVTKRAAISQLAGEHQAASQRWNWFARPFVATYFGFIRAGHCVHLAGLWAKFAALWCFRSSLILSACVIALCLVGAVIGAISDSRRSSEFASSGAPVSVGPSPSASADSTTSAPAPTPSQPPSPTYSEPSLPTHTGLH